MIIIKIRRHPRLPNVAVVAVPEDGNALMGRFGPARLSPPDRGYLVPDDQVDALKRLLTRHDARVIDTRDETLAEIGPLPYDPLPECAACGEPTARDLAETYLTCPACEAPWTAYQPATWTPVRDTPGDPEAAAAAALERLARGVRAARAVLGPRQLPPADAADVAVARALRCPWCNAPPYVSCTVAGSGRPLTLTAAHPSRHTAAGVGPPRIDLDQVLARRAPGIAHDPPEPDHPRTTRPTAGVQ